MIKEHRVQTEALKATHLEETEDLKRQLEEAEANADVRVSKVQSAAHASSAIASKNEADLTERLNAALSSVAATQKITKDLDAQLAAIQLANEQEAKEAKARQATLEAQVKAMSSANAKAVATASRAYADLQRRGEAAAATAKHRVKELEAQLVATKSASRAVSASFKQLEEESFGLRRKLKRASARAAAATALLKLGAERFRAAEQIHGEALRQAEAQRSEAERDAQARAEELESDAQELESDAQERAEAAEARAEAAEEAVGLDRAELVLQKEKLAEAVAKTAAAESDARAAKSAREDSERRAKALEGKVSSLRAEAQRAAEEAKTRTGPTSQEAAAQHFMHHVPQHQAAFPQKPFTIDPMLESSISSLHSALNSITALARSASTNAREAEVANGKLAALSSFGIVHEFVHPRQQYYA
jgi:DNA repair exonuclease SbcCD ATPase subunit